MRPERPPLKPHRQPSKELWQDLQQQGFRRIVGLDEVGRGALAGPLTVAAVELPIFIDGVNDSKLLSAIARENFSREIRRSARQITLGWASNQEIDELGLSMALALAYERALENITADLLLTDYYKLNVKNSYWRAVKGDRLFYPVAAASIIAKVCRDQLMRSYARFFPHYGWETNVGYGTFFHKQAIATHGPTRLHRQLFLG